MYPYQINYWNIKNNSECVFSALFQLNLKNYFGVIGSKLSYQITNTQEEL